MGIPLTDALASARARTAYGNALALARAASLDSLAIDTLHMYAFVDRTPADELRYVDQALALLQASTQPDAKGWEASLRNNRGYALQQLRRYDEALAEFRRALAAREKQGKPRGIRIAHWMSVSISGGTVAENSDVWRSRGQRSRMRRTSGRNPMSSMRSASSITRISTRSNRT